jgi:hypothetical protein
MLIAKDIGGDKTRKIIIKFNVDYSLNMESACKILNFRIEQTCTTFNNL